MIQRDAALDARPEFIHELDEIPVDPLAILVDDLDCGSSAESSGSRDESTTSGLTEDETNEGPFSLLEQFM